MKKQELRKLIREEIKNLKEDFYQEPTPTPTDPIKELEEILSQFLKDNYGVEDYSKYINGYVTHNGDTINMSAVEYKPGKYNTMDPEEWRDMGNDLNEILINNGFEDYEVIPLLRGMGVRLVK